MTNNNQEAIKNKENIVIIAMEFKNEEKLPLKFNYENENLIPAFEISNVPEDAKSLAIIMEDTDAPGGNITNWIVYNIDPNQTKIGGDIPFGTIGKNSWTMKNYQGAIPIAGRHMYRFTIYAMKEELKMNDDYNSNELRDLIRENAFEKGFVEAYAEKQGFFALA